MKGVQATLRAAEGPSGRAVASFTFLLPRSGCCRMSYSTRVFLWRDFYDDELVLFATGVEPDLPDEEAPQDAAPAARGSLCVLGSLHLDAVLDLFGFEAYTRVAKATRQEALFPVEISLRFYNEDGR